METGNWRLEWLGRAPSSFTHPSHLFSRVSQPVGVWRAPKAGSSDRLQLSRIFRRCALKVYNPRASTWDTRTASGDGLGVRRWLRRHARFKISHCVHLFPLSPLPHAVNLPTHFASAIKVGSAAKQPARRCVGGQRGLDVATTGIWDCRWGGSDPERRGEQLFGPAIKHCALTINTRCCSCPACECHK